MIILFEPQNVTVVTTRSFMSGILFFRASKTTRKVGESAYHGFTKNFGHLNLELIICKTSKGTRRVF